MPVYQQAAGEGIPIIFERLNRDKSLFSPLLIKEELRC